MKRKFKHWQVFPRKKSTQTPWKIEPIKEVESLEEITRESLSCSICMDYLSVPHTTPCGHVFCYCCIYKWLEQDPICPQCRKSVDAPPYPVYILSNQVDLALLKYPDIATTIRIGKDLDYYKSFSDPWAELYSSQLFFDDNMYSSSSEDDDHIQNVSGFQMIPVDSDTSSDESRGNSEISIDNMYLRNHGYTVDEEFSSVVLNEDGPSPEILLLERLRDQQDDYCSSDSDDESSPNEPLSTSLEPQLLEPEPPQEIDELARPRRSRRLRSD